MALTHLLDTSVLTRLRHAAIREAIEPLAEQGQLARTGISDLEIGYSARNADEWDQLSEALDAFALVEASEDHLRRARQVQRLLAERHQRGRKVPDLLIAAAARSISSARSDESPSGRWGRSAQSINPTAHQLR